MSIAYKIRLRQLRCFVTVARKNSFMLAAEELGLTQPAVSRSVKELEQILGQDLFDRSIRGAVLTNRGQAFLAAAESGLLQIWQGAEEASGSIRADELVRVGALPNVCSRFLPPIVRAFKAEHPHVNVRVTPGTNAALLASLRRGETDFVIGRLSSSEDMRGLIFEALYDEPLVFVVGEQHPLSSDASTLQEILPYPLLVPPEGTIIRLEVSRFLASHGVMKLADTIESTSSDFQRAYLTISNAVAIIPRGVVQAELDSGGLRQLAIDSDQLRGPVGLTLNPGSGLGMSAQRFLQLVRSSP